MVRGPNGGQFLLPESTVQSRHEIFQVDPVFLRKLSFAQNVVRIQILSMMPGTKRDRREVCGLLPHAPGAQDVRVGRFD